MRKISPPQGFDPRTVQPVSSRYFKCKFNFLRSKCFRLLNQTKGNMANNCNCFKLIFPVRGGHRDFSSRAPDTAAAPLAITFLSTSIHTQTPLGKNPNVRAKKPASHCLRYCTLLARTYIHAPNWDPKPGSHCPSERRYVPDMARIPGWTFCA